MNELKALSVGYLIFSILIAGEAAWAYRARRHEYRLGEFITNVGHGMLFQVMDVFTKSLVMLPFMWASTHVAVATLPMDHVLGWLLGLLLYDHCSYWRHRHHHEVHFLWAVHGVHHAAEDFNLAAALRQAIFQNALGWIWYLPLALCMPVDMLIALIVLDYGYQFLQHTRFVPRLGPIGWIFNTPSHHRVHHGTEEKYLDKNYGGILIIWDRLYGTFQREEEEPTYGLTKPLRTLNPLWANLAIFSDLADATRRTASVRAAVDLWRLGPGAEARLAPGGTLRPGAPLENRDIPTSTAVRSLATFIPSGFLLAALVWTPAGHLVPRLGLGLLVLTGTITAAAILEQRWWARPLAAARLGIAAGLWWSLPLTPTAQLALVAMVVTSLAADILGLGATGSSLATSILRQRSGMATPAVVSTEVPRPTP